jgi:hypothetical protein
MFKETVWNKCCIQIFNIHKISTPYLPGAWKVTAIIPFSPGIKIGHFTTDALGSRPEDPHANRSSVYVKKNNLQIRNVREYHLLRCDAL